MLKPIQKCSFFIALLCAAVFLIGPAESCMAKDPWGLVSEYGEQDPEGPNFQNTAYIQFAMHKMLTNTPIKYAITFDDYPGKTPQTDEQWIQKADALVRTSFNRWPQDVIRTIRSSGRERDLQDVLKTLQRHPLILTRTSAQEADIVFSFDNSKSAAFLFDQWDLSKQKTIRAVNPAYFGPEEEKKLPDFLLHEIGHYYGLGDRYQEGLDGSSPLYSTSEGTDGDSLMALGRNGVITLDDVDGFINLMDVTQAFAARRFNKRAQKGWVSFSDPTRIYARGKELNRQAFFDGRTIYIYNKDGSIKSRRPGRTKSIYNPLAEKQATQGPFRSVQNITSADTDIETSVDYTKLAEQGYFRGISRVANLIMLTFEGKRKEAQKWDLQFDYQRGLNGFKEQSQQHFTLQVQPDVCHVRAKEYGDSFKNLQIEFHPKTGQFLWKSIAIDVTSNNSAFDLQVSGTENDSRFVYTQGNKAYHLLWKNNSIYREKEETDDADDNLFFTADNIDLVRKVLKDGRSFCEYLNALGR